MILWQSCTKERRVRVALKRSVASSSFSDSIVSWMTRSSCSSGVREVRAPSVEDRLKRGVHFSRAGWVSFASALDSAILQLALHVVRLDTETSSSQFGHDLRRRTGYLLSLFAPITHSWLSTVLRHSVLPTRIGHMPATPSFAFQTAPAVQVASFVMRDHHSAQQLLLFTVVTVVVTGTLCFFTVSLSLSLFAPVLGSGPVVHLQALFRVKDGLPRRPTHSIQRSRLHHTPLTWRRVRALASSPCTQR